jgi:hypothetical protein
LAALVIVGLFARDGSGVASVGNDREGAAMAAVMLMSIVLIAGLCVLEHRAVI